MSLTDTPQKPVDDASGVLAHPPSADATPPDLFALGQRAAEKARAQNEGRGVFARSRQLLANGTWKGPRDAAESYVEEADLGELGGLAAAREAGARTLVAATVQVAREAATAGMRVIVRLPYRAGEPDSARILRISAISGLCADGVAIDGVLPTPEREPMGLDTIRLYATCRLETAIPHLLADFERLGHRLAQMSLGFGADELFGPILPERALRLGTNAHNPVLTRKEAAVLLRGAGLRPCERLSNGTLEEVTS
jgi:hypothetical protein